ncbi:MAG: hypothetical protein P4N59_09220 [Negativicutes bacterium]|nr:hypothetical protein [Negativicutes bacterium]
MTAKIIPFPTQTEVSLTTIDKKLRVYLAELTGDNQLVEHVAERMKTFIKKYTYKTFSPEFDLPLPPLSPAQTKTFSQALERGVQNVVIQVQDMINQIIFERLFLEVEIYEKMHGHKAALVLGNLPGIFESLPHEYREKVNYLVTQLKNPDLKPQEKYLLYKLLESVLEEQKKIAEPS